IILCPQSSKVVPKAPKVHLFCGLLVVLLPQTVLLAGGDSLVDPAPRDDTSTSPCSEAPGLTHKALPIGLDSRGAAGALRGSDLVEIDEPLMWRQGIESSLISTDSLMNAFIVGPSENGTNKAGHPPAVANGGDDEGRKSAQPWPVYAAMLGLLLVSVIVFEYLHLRWSETDFNENISTPQENTQGGSTNPLEVNKMLSLVRPYFSGRTGKKSSWRYAM
ncbi:hypothetical protein FOZ63_029642, partial [Perkinsus olseni]